jgi:hypothetical protein
MPTNRTPISRAHRNVQVTPESVALFQRTEALFPIYLGCIRDACHLATEGQRCSDCAEYLDANRTLNSRLGILPHVADLDTVTDPTPPVGLDPIRVKAWHRVWGLRRALESEVAKRKVSA